VGRHVSIIRKLKRALRGEVKPKTVVLESVRRSRAARQTRHERANLDSINNEMPKLRLQLSPEELLKHFQNRVDPHFSPHLSAESFASLQKTLFPAETEQLLINARQIVEDHSWPLLGFGLKRFGDDIDWCRDPLSGYNWPLNYHRDIRLFRNDGSDVRVLWELNRLGHFLTLARAYVISGDETLSAECFEQLRCWAKQNPYGRGANWNCAMEVALRAINLLAVFELLKKSIHFNADILQLFLRLFYQHGTYIRNNPEFSYISTSNHYLSDVAGLVWLGVLLPEFVDSKYYLETGLAELLSEMDKQVLADGADFESSTGYHRYALELFLYSFILCKQNDVQIPAKYWEKLRAMAQYVHGYLRPDGTAPLIGDTDSGQILPLLKRRADEHGYVLSIVAAFFKDERLRSANVELAPELLWILGEEGVHQFGSLQVRQDSSTAFPHAGTYVMRKDDRYLCFNASGAGINGRGSHGHNDSLSIEVFASGKPFIVDPGTYVYTADLRQRQLFRSTAYHSTVTIDRRDQNTTNEELPFVIGDEAHPRVVEWKSDERFDRIVAEHSGYARLPSPVVHRRTVLFDKVEETWLIEDDFLGHGDHEYEVRFHFAPDIALDKADTSVTAAVGNSKLMIAALDGGELVLEMQSSSRDYGEKRESITACWRVSGQPGKLRWKISVVDISK